MNYNIKPAKMKQPLTVVSFLLASLITSTVSSQIPWDDVPLIPSGLMGPVRFTGIKQVEIPSD